MNRIFNFSAGPANLPLVVLERAKNDLCDYRGSCMSVMEMSHRSKWFDEIINATEANFKKLLNLSDDYQVLFLQGGASLQFSMLALNFLTPGKTGEYLITGAWGDKAIKEAKKVGEVKAIWNGKDTNYNRTPKNDEYQVNPNAAYLHYTSNETIQGVEFPTEPQTGAVPLFCDASSDFLSRPLDIKKYAFIYAGAQKNLGPSGVCIGILRKDLLERVPNNLASLLDYKLLAENKSLYNTPPCFSIHMVKLVTDWILNDMGGLEKVHQHNIAKAKVIYDVIDAYPNYFKGHAVKENRSLMNVTFTLPSEDLEKQLIKKAAEQGLIELGGHRSVGGLRASIYNAMPIEGCQKLAGFMKEFASRA